MNMHVCMHAQDTPNAKRHSLGSNSRPPKTPIFTPGLYEGTLHSCHKESKFL